MKWKGEEGNGKERRKKERRGKMKGKVRKGEEGGKKKKPLFLFPFIPPSISSL